VVGAFLLQVYSLLLVDAFCRSVLGHSYLLVLSSLLVLSVGPFVAGLLFLLFAGLSFPFFVLPSYLSVHY
jgi:hypothetical protein